MKLQPALVRGGLLLVATGTASAFNAPGTYRAHLSRQQPRAQRCSPLQVVDISEEAVRDVESMQAWAQGYGVQNIPGLQLTSDDGSDIYAMTNEDVPAGSAIMFVPSNMFLSSWGAKAETGQLTEAEDLIERLNGLEDLPQFYIFVKILLEYQNGEESPFFPWLNSLPRKFDSGAAMTPACYDCLPPLAAALAMEERVKYINCNQALKTVPFISDEIKADKDLTKWAFNVVATRSLPVQGESVIVPMVDMVR